MFQTFISRFSLMQSATIGLVVMNITILRRKIISFSVLVLMILSPDKNKHSQKCTNSVRCGISYCGRIISIDNFRKTLKCAIFEIFKLSNNPLKLLISLHFVLIFLFHTCAHNEIPPSN